MAETWLPVVGFPHYEVSDAGSVRSIDRIIVRANGSPLTVKGRELKQFPRSKVCKYLAVTLHGENGVMTTVSVHNLVMEAHVGPRPPGMHVLHKDDNHTDNRLTSLRYGTQSENEAEKKPRSKCRKGLHDLPVTGGRRRCEPCYRDWYESRRAA